MRLIHPDARTAVRAFFRAPGFSLAAVVTLALGIGANTALFSVIRAVLFAPPLYPGAARLAMLADTVDQSGDDYPVRMADYIEWRSRVRSRVSATTSGS